MKYSTDHFISHFMNQTWYKPGVRVLCAYSGGLDSTILFHLLKRLPESETGIIHINHNLRQQESIEDEKFVRKSGRQSGVHTIVLNENIPDKALQHGFSIEEMGNRVRYERFEEQRLAHGYDYVATAHTADDVRETQLINLYLGTGIRGLAAIESETDTLVRPLLSFTKDQLADYADTMGLDYRVDSSNQDRTFLRNRIRHDFLPPLMTITNVRATEELNQINTYAKRLNNMIMRSLEHDDIQDVMTVYPDKVLLKMPESTSFYVPIQKGLFDRAFQRLSKAGQGLSEQHFQAIRSLSSTDRVGKSIDLPHGIKATRDRHNICFFKPDSYDWSPRNLSSIDHFKGPFFNMVKRNYILDENVIISPFRFWFTESGSHTMILRRHRTGDELMTDENEKRAINRILQESHVAPHTKSFYPVLEIDGEVVWVPGVRTDTRWYYHKMKDEKIYKKTCFEFNFDRGIFE